MCNNDCVAQRKVIDATTGTILFFHGDHLNSASVMTDYSGFEHQRLQYFPYGGTRYEYPIDESVKHRFTGHEKDFAIGIYYAQARYYDQRLARFISCDPLGPQLADPQTLNPYAYCLNNPLIYVDPTGEKQEEEDRGFITAVYELVGDILGFFVPIKGFDDASVKVIEGAEQGKDIDIITEEAIEEVTDAYSEPVNYAPDLIPGLGKVQEAVIIAEDAGKVVDEGYMKKLDPGLEIHGKHLRELAPSETKDKRSKKENERFNRQKKI